MTGHADGVITLNIAEADDLERERRRLKMKEDYRTVLGHFRHESGHYYWQQLVQGSEKLELFQSLFGNENEDYQLSMSNHYQYGSIANWQEQYISAYAGSHPWEDFAETWAHYILIADTLETAKQFNFSDEPFDSYHAESFDDMLKFWLPLTLSVNNINRSAGQPDLYPFVLSARVIEKLKFIHALIHGLKT